MGRKLAIEFPLQKSPLAIKLLDRVKVQVVRNIAIHHQIFATAVAGTVTDVEVHGHAFGLQNVVVFINGAGTPIHRTVRVDAHNHWVARFDQTIALDQCKLEPFGQIRVEVKDPDDPEGCYSTAMQKLKTTKPETPLPTPKRLS